jgi:hypothetical protein
VVSSSDMGGQARSDCQLKVQCGGIRWWSGRWGEVILPIEGECGGHYWIQFLLHMIEPPDLLILIHQGLHPLLFCVWLIRKCNPTGELTIALFEMWLTNICVVCVACILCTRQLNAQIRWEMEVNSPKSCPCLLNQSRWMSYVWNQYVWFLIQPV